MKMEREGEKEREREVERERGGREGIEHAVSMKRKRAGVI